jgi:hypothetical protein
MVMDNVGQQYRLRYDDVIYVVEALHRATARDQGTNRWIAINAAYVQNFRDSPFSAHPDRVRMAFGAFYSDMMAFCTEETATACAKAMKGSWLLHGRGGVRSEKVLFRVVQISRREVRRVIHQPKYTRWHPAPILGDLTPEPMERWYDPDYMRNQKTVWQMKWLKKDGTFRAKAKKM